MKNAIDPMAFGKRVRERREEFGWGQTRLAKESGYSQTNIGWIEQGKAKDPRKQAIKLAEALHTTTDWLLYARGPRQTGPRILTTEQFSQIYDLIPQEGKEALIALADKYVAGRKRA